MCTQVVREDIKGGDVVEVEANDIGAQRFPAPLFKEGKYSIPCRLGRRGRVSSAHCYTNSRFWGLTVALTGSRLLFNN